MDELIFIVGNGASTSLNIQAVLEDYFASSKRQKKTLSLVIPFNTKPSPGQVIAHQYGNKNQVDSIVVTDRESDVGQFASASVSYIDGPATQLAGEMMTKTPSKVFMLYDDEDPLCNIWLQIAQANGVAAFDLCQGLFPIDPVAVITPVPSPAIPEAEKMAPEASQPVLEGSEEDDEEYEDEDDDEGDFMDDEDEELMEELFSVIYKIARKIAEEVVLEIKDSKKK